MTDKKRRIDAARSAQDSPLPVSVQNPSGDATQLEEGTVLANIYEIQGPIPGFSAEAESYLCTSRGQLYVAKVFLESSRLVPETAGALVSVESPYSAKCYRAGLHLGRPFQIYPFYRAGSVENKTYGYEIIQGTLLPCLNRGLRAIHAKGIVDTDLKPSNIMQGEGKGAFVITDYGRTAVRSLADTCPPEDAAAPWYAAPELIQGRPEAASDYFSLGITVYRLFAGRMPFDGMPEEEMERYVLSGLFPYPADMPVRLQHLIAGLTFREVMGPGGPAGTDRRWGYHEVRRWCEGEDPIVPVSPENRGITLPPYAFRNEKYPTVSELTEALARHWSEGKAEMFSGRMANFFGTEAPEVEQICSEAEQEVAARPKTGDVAFFRALYRLSPILGNIFWKGKDLGSPGLVGSQLMHDAGPDILDELIRRGALSTFVEIRRPAETEAIQVMKSAEDAYAHTASESARRRFKEVLGRILAREYDFTIDGRTFSDLQQFASWCLKLRRDEPERWESLAQTLVPEPGALDPGFESWLEATGNQQAVMSWSGGRNLKPSPADEPEAQRAHGTEHLPRDDSRAVEDALRAVSRKRGLR